MSKQRERYQVTIITRKREYQTEVKRLSSSEHYELFQNLLEKKRSREIRDFILVRAKED